MGQKVAFEGRAYVRVAGNDYFSGATSVNSLTDVCKK